MIYKNAGSGTLQIASGVSQTFDGGSDITLAPTEGATVFANGSNFSFVKHGSSGVSSFSYTSISIAGTGNYTLSASEYAKTAIKLTGTLTGNRNVIVPAAVRDYWINNATSGAFSVTVKTSGGSGVVVTQGKKSTLYCDGTDVIAADTDYPSGISTPVVVADGGTGATTADAALTNLGGTTTGKSLFTAASGASARSALSAAASGANTDISSVYLNNTGLKVRDTDASNGLSIVPGSNLSADRTLTVTTGDASRTLDISAGNVTISSAGAALIDDATAADQRTTLGLVIGTNVQAYDAELAALAGLISAADRLPYFTGAGTAALATFTSAGRALIDDADAAAQRTTLGLGTAATLDETTAAQFRNNTADKVLSTDQVWSAAGRVALTWSSGGTTAVDLNAGINFTLTTSTGNSTLGAPTNAKTGQSGFIEITQDAVTPRTLGFASAWVFDGGTDPTLTATASAKDILYYTVLDSTGPVVHATLRKAVA